MKLKAALFDLDGTLLNTLEDLYLTMTSVLKSGGYPLISHNTVKHFIGNGAREFMRLSLPENARDEENIDKYLLKYHTEYDKFGYMTTKPYDGINEILKILNDNNIPVGIISNKPHKATVNVIKNYFPDIWFKAVMGQTEKFPPKPDPASALYIINKLGFSPSETALIGDGDTDVKTAEKGGFYQAAVLWGYRTKEELAAVGATNFINNPKEILTLFNL